jgi:hypothetical protein
MQHPELDVKVEDFPGESWSFPLGKSRRQGFVLIDARQSFEVAQPWLREPEWPLAGDPDRLIRSGWAWHL